MKKTTLLAGVAALSLLAGCGPLISFGDGEPETVYTLRTEDLSLDDGTGPFLFVASPSFSEGLGGRKVAVMLGEYERSTLKDVRWATDAGDLIRDYLVASLRQDTNSRTLGEDGLDVKSRCRLNNYVWSMDFVPGEGGDQVHLRMETSLLDLFTGAMISRKTFDERVDVSGGKMSIMVGFNTAMQSTGTKMASWLNEGGFLADCVDTE